jgi:hypothetical protein
LSFHQNADASGTEGIKVEAPGAFISHTLGISVSSVASISTVATAKSNGATMAIVFNPNSGAVYFTLDGTTPTDAVGGGLPIAPGGSVTLSITDAANAKFIGATSAVISVWFFQ